MTRDSLKHLLERYKHFEKTIEARKKRGMNDFNPLLCVQKAHDEVNMHSGFIYELLNPRGSHCQDSLFLELYLNRIDLAVFFGQCERAVAHKERGNVDITLSNGAKHIIIENKIWSDDQNGQIARYIEALAAPQEEDCESIAYEDIAVVYLSPQGRTPKDTSLTHKNARWSISADGEYLTNGEHRLPFRQISYEGEILEWLKKCVEEVGAISNLRVALESYADVVKTMLGQKKENTMNIAAFLKDDKQATQTAWEFLSHSNEIAQALLESLGEELEQRYAGWMAEVEDNALSVWHKDFAEDYGLCFYMELDTKKHITWIGVCLSGEYGGSSKDEKTKLIETLYNVVGEQDSQSPISKPDTLYDNYLISFSHKEPISTDDREKFYRFFEAHKDTIHALNAKIKADLDKGSDSKLATLLEG